MITLRLVDEDVCVEAAGYDAVLAGGELSVIAYSDPDWTAEVARWSGLPEQPISEGLPHPDWTLKALLICNEAGAQVDSYQFWCPA